MSYHIGHVAIQVVDLERASEYARRTIGLSETFADDRQVLLSSNDKHHELQLIAGAEVGLHHVGLELQREGDLEQALERAVAAGARLLPSDAEEPGLGDSFRLKGPGGLVYEIYGRMERERLDPARYIAEPRARRFGHVTFMSEAHREMVGFWLDGLGFRISDEAAGVTWARCDSHHHGLAVRATPAGSGTFMHHHAWELRDLAQLGRACDSLAGEGIRLLWGPVRHGPGFNCAAYFPDGQGAVIELYSDLLEIDDDETYVPIDWSDEPAALNLWGPLPGEKYRASGIRVLPSGKDEKADGDADPGRAAGSGHANPTMRP